MKHIKQILFVLCFFQLFMSSCTQKEASESTSQNRDKQTGDYHKIRVLTYNIQHGKTTSGNIDMDLYAQIIKEQNPDIVALQEIDCGTRRSGAIDEPAELAKRVGLKHYFGKYRDYQGGGFGDAILTNYPVFDFKVIPANSSFDEVPRAYIFAKLKIADSTVIYFNDSHLSHSIEEQATIQAKELTDYWEEELNKAPLIIAGDLNSTPASNAMKELFRSFSASDQDLKPTFSARTSPKRKIDYILYPENPKWKVFETELICREDASDHCALMAVLGIKKTIDIHYRIIS